MFDLKMLAELQIWHVAGWTMLHYLWLGALIGLAALASKLLLHGATANVRYAAALTFLLLLTVLPAGIAAWLASGFQGLPIAANNAVQQPPTLAAETVELPELMPIETGVNAQLDTASVGNAPLQPGIEPIASQSTSIFSIASAAQYVRFLPWLWIIGTPITFALLTAGIVGANRLRSVSRPISDARFEQLLSQLQSSLDISRQVAVAVCERIASPVLIGIIRPIILLPPAALTGWSPEEIEMVLLHELAHVRRWDNLVNLIQRLVESLLFFHPVVWMVSSWARRERESCCDEFVVARTDRPHAYAELLVALAAQMPRSVLFHPAASSAMAAGPLRSRIRRILQLENDPMLVSGKSLAITLGSLLIVATLAVLYLPNRGQADAPGMETADDKEQQVADDQVKSENSSLAPPAKIEIRADSNTVDDFGAVNQPSTLSEPAPTSTSATATAQPQSTGRFPSLEDQKLADLAWKRLGLELETIGAEDSTRIKALGYDGGLRVIGRPGNVVRMTADRNGQGILTGDILVGLHVWPTTNLKDVATVLQRDDLSELDPLKFYVVRDIPAKLSAENPQPTFAVITGRIEINQPRQSSNPNPYYWSSTNSPANPVVEPNRQPTQTQNTTHADSYVEPRPVTQRLAPGTAAVSDTSTNPFGPRPGTPQPAPLTALAADAFANPYAVSAPVIADSSSTSPERRQAAPTAAPSTNTPAELFAGRPAKPEAYGLAPTPASNAQPATPGNEDRIVEAYAIPNDVKPDVKQHQRIAHLRGLWDEKGRFILQATRADHDRFKNILDATPKWRASIRSGQPGTERPRITLRKENDQTILEWLPTGMVLSYEQVPSKGRSAVIVKSVTPGSPAAWQDVRPGDLLLGVDDFGTTSLAELTSVDTSLADGFPDRDKQVSAEFVRFTEHDGGTRDEHLRKELPLHFQSQERLGISQPPLMQAQPVPPTRDAPAAEPIQPTLNAPIPADPAQVNRPATQLVPGQPIESNQATQLRQPVQAPSATPSAPRYPLHFDGKKEGASKRPATSPRNESSQPAAPPTPLYPGDAPSADNAHRPNSELRYDGKTFYDWRNEWQTELSTKKRLDAVRALAAFGRAGYGKQAAEAILDVAGEYDFRAIDNSVEGNLKWNVLDEFAPYGHTQSMAPYWLPILAERLKKEPAKWSAVAVELLRRVQTDDEGATAVLRSLAETAPVRVRPAALVALIRASRLQTGGPQIDDTTQALLTASLNSDDPEAIRQSIDALYYQSVPGADLRMVYQPEVIPLLFHADESVRTGARYLLARIQDDDAPKVVESLLEILKDDSRKSDYITAIRALGAIGPKAGAQPQLEEIFNNEANEMPVRVAAAYAIDKIEGGTRFRNDVNAVINRTNDEKTQTRYIQLLNEEQRATNE